jgi:Ca2+-binding RTX toxin-like protein
MIQLMKSRSLILENLRRAVPLAISLLAATGLSAKPAIQAVDVNPNPLLLNRAFTVTVAATPDVTFATATLDFRPGAAPSLQIPLTKQGAVWTGTGAIPSGLRVQSNKDEAKVTVAVIDAALHRDEQSIRVDIVVPTVMAVFANGVLTVSGDDNDNRLIVSGDALGTIVVNGGAISIIGGPATTNNTSLIQVFGFGGNDTITIDDANGPMPSANLFGGDGDDVLTGSAAADMLDGGPGNDTLNGRGGDDRLFGGPGNDILIGGTGSDLLAGGEGDDQIIWNPGDGSDRVEGQEGIDTLVFNGSNASETIDLSAIGPRFRFFRNVGSIVMDCAGIERVVFRALSGADAVTVNDLTGTQVTNVVVDLSSSLGAGDGQADMVIVNGTATNDLIALAGSTNRVDVHGLSATVTVLGAESDLDKLVINGLAGDDVIDASAVQSGAIALTLNGGAGNDTLIGGDGNDLLIGGQGSDTILGGAGNDTFIWNPGDGSDLIEGQAGQDTMVFNGANIAEVIDISANGQRLRFARDIAGIVMDANGIEIVQFNALGGADRITVNDLTGTAVTTINLDLGAPAQSGNGDNQADTVIVNGTTGPDNVTISGSSATGVSVTGLSAAVNIVGTDPLLDQLIVKLLEGDDIAQAADLAAGVINLTLDGGPGNDVLIGSAGDDVLLGGEGDDILNGGPGQDALDGGPGSNVIIQ